MDVGNCEPRTESVSFSRREGDKSKPVQAFINGIKDLEFTAKMKLSHHTSLREELAHALYVVAVRQLCEVLVEIG